MAAGGNVTMSSNAQDLNAKVERTHRNILKVGAILGSAALAKVDETRARYVRLLLAVDIAS